jgi:D-amino-acid dehydrogenase
MAAAEEGSFANAGVMAPGYVTPWAAPGMPFKVAKHLFSRHAPVRFSWPLSTNDLTWMWRFLRSCRHDTYVGNRTRMQALAFYSRDRFDQISDELKLELDRSKGQLILLRSARDRALMEASLQVLRSSSIPYQELTPAQALLIEPGLNPDVALHGAIHLPQAEVANCRQFAMLLKSQAQHMGVEFAFNTQIDKIDPGAPMALHVAGEDQARTFDSVVLCAGVDSTRLLLPLGLKIPIVAVHGYSVSAAIRDPMHAPLSGVVDERYKVAISRLGNRVRVAGSAEIGGSVGVKNDRAIMTLYKVLNDWFPGAAHQSGGVQTWKGSRPMLPDGPPLLGASGVPGLWLNIGHGSSGWAMSCGSARATADLIGKRQPEIDLEGLDISRLKL